MAIGSGAFIEFFGDQDSVDSSTTSAVSDGAFSSSGDLLTWTNDDDAPFAALVLDGATFDTAPDASSNIEVFAQLLNVSGSNDALPPSSTLLETFIGTFSLEVSTAPQYPSIVVKLPNTKTSQEYDFYIRNQGGQTLSSGWGLLSTPTAIGPHA